MELKSILKKLNLKSDQIELLLNEETPDEKVNEVLEAHKASRDAYYENQVLPKVLEDKTKGKLSVIKVKKIINSHHKLGFSSDELNDPDIKIEDLLAKKEQIISEEKKTWGTDANEKLRSELTEYKDKYGALTQEKQTLLDSMESFKTETQKKADEALRKALVETNYAKMERGKKDVLSDSEGVAYNLELIKKTILNEYHITAEGKVLDKGTMTQAKFPDEERLIESLDDIWMHNARKANIIKQGNGGQKPKVLAANGNPVQTTEKLSPQAAEQLQRLQKLQQNN